MTGLLRLSRVFEGLLPTWCMARTLFSLMTQCRNDTVPSTAVGCGCRRPWFTSGSLASSPPVRGSVHLPVGLAGAAVRDIRMTYGEHYEGDRHDPGPCVRHPKTSP
jgi:hypothetical protein